MTKECKYRQTKTDRQRWTGTDEHEKKTNEMRDERVTKIIR